MGFLAALHQPAALWQEIEHILIPITVLLSGYGYGNKKVPFCQANYTLSISSALLRVVSVMFAPPMMRASSRFLPSISNGVTEV